MNTIFLEQLVTTTLHQWWSKDSKYRLFWKWPSIACYGVRGRVIALTERRKSVEVEPWHKPRHECTYWFSLSYWNDYNDYSAGDIHKRIWTVFGIMVWTKFQGCYLRYEQQVVCNWVSSFRNGRTNIHDEYNHKGQSLFSSASKFVQSLLFSQWANPNVHSFLLIAHSLWSIPMVHTIHNANSSMYSCWIVFTC